MTALRFSNGYGRYITDPTAPRIPFDAALEHLDWRELDQLERQAAELLAQVSEKYGTGESGGRKARSSSRPSPAGLLPSPPGLRASSPSVLPAPQTHRSAL
jgi:hypothetical protein